MSPNSGPSTVAPTPGTDLSIPPLEPRRLKGNLGVFQLLSTILAFAAPLLSAMGYIAVVIFFAGTSAPAIFIISMLLIWFFSVGFTYMGRKMSNPGAFYSYITAGLGRELGLGGALLAVLTYILLYLGALTFFGVTAGTFVEETLGGPAVPWYWYALALWAGVSIIGYLRLEISTRLMVIVMAIEILVVAVFNVFTFVDGGPEGNTLPAVDWSGFVTGGLGIAILFAILLFNGFEATAVFREEVKSPTRTIPRATYLVVAFIGIFYAITAWAMISAVGASNAQQVAIDNQVGMFPDALGMYVGSFAVDVARILVITSIFAALLAIQNVTSRYVYSLGVDGVVPKALGRVHPKHGSPYLASVLISILLFLCELPFVLLGTDPETLYARQSGAGGFGYLILFFLTSVAVIAYFRRKDREGPKPVWQTIVAPLVAVAGFASLLVFSTLNFSLMVGDAGIVGALLQLLLWGSLLVGAVWAAILRKKKSSVYLRIGRRE